MKILILGAAGEIGRILTQDLLQQTDHQLCLYARDASKRIKRTNNEREQLFDGDFKQFDHLINAMKGVDIVYINDMGNKASTKTIVEAMEKSGIKRVIAATILGIYDEVIGPFGEWNRRMVGAAGTQRQKESSAIIENSSLDYTLLRLTWLYNQKSNKNYMLSQKGEPFIGAQVTREAVSQLIVDIIQCNDKRYSRKSLGVSEPNTDWPKPSFY